MFVDDVYICYNFSEFLVEKGFLKKNHYKAIISNFQQDANIPKKDLVNFDDTENVESEEDEDEEDDDFGTETTEGSFYNNKSESSRGDSKASSKTSTKSSSSSRNDSLATIESIDD